MSEEKKTDKQNKTIDPELIKTFEKSYKYWIIGVHAELDIFILRFYSPSDVTGFRNDNGIRISNQGDILSETYGAMKIINEKQALAEYQRIRKQYPLFKEE